MKIEINSDLLSVMLLRSLPESYENFRCAIASRDELPKPETLRVKILEEYETRKDMCTKSRIQSAMVVGKYEKFQNKSRREKHEKAETTNKDNKIKCFKCHKFGHMARDCRGARGSKGQSANRAENVGLHAASNHASDVFRVCENAGRGGWCIDSGCTSHMCNDVDVFQEIDLKGHGKFNMANSESTDIRGRGSAFLATDVNGCEKVVTFHDTLYVPDLRTNLISVAKITEKGYRVIFDKKKAKVVDNSGKAVLVAERVNGLYYMKDKRVDECKNIDERDNTVRSSRKNSLEDWHVRLGHLNVQALRQAVKTGSFRVVDVKNVNDDFECEVCVKGKMSRAPFPKKSLRKSSAGDLVHSDVCGPMRVASLGRNRYFITFIDDYSGWCEVKFVEHKNQVLCEFENFRALMETQKGRKIKCLQSDNGLEYVNKRFDEFIRKHGITRRLTVPYNPEQNGVAERRNRTLMETARCLLIQAGLPASFWAEAVNTANFIRNRCPTSKLQGKTPYEAWHGKPPDVSHFERFGCDVLVLDPTPNKSKLASRAIKGTFVGYSEESKGYRIWIPNERRIVVLRDVKFLRNVPTQKSGYFDDFIPEQHHSQQQLELGDKIQLTQNHQNSDDNADETERSEQQGEEIEEAGDKGYDDVLRSHPSDLSTVEKRGPGRPKRILSGRRGRPREVYQTISRDAEETLDHGGVEAEEKTDIACLTEVPISQALSSTESDEWVQAMAEEVKAILKNKTLELVKRPKGRDIVGSRFVLRNKHGANGILEKRKARIVARGFSQQPGRYFHETYAPVARLSSVRLAVAIAARRNMFIRQYDVTTAYLNGTLEEEVFMELPEMIDEALRRIIEDKRSDHRIVAEAKVTLDKLAAGDQVCMMKKALYGLKQAGRAWHKRLDKELRDLGAQLSNGDPCLYIKGQGEDMTILVVYVDDILIMSCCLEAVELFGTNLGKRFDVKSIGKLERCLGIDFVEDCSGIKVSQKTYVNDLLQRFGMKDCKPVSTPLDVGTKLTKTKEWSAKDGPRPPYRELIGGLLYLSVATRPDVTHAARVLSQFNDCFGKAHWTAAKRVLRYLKGTADVGITYKRGEGNFEGYVDADWAGSIHDRRSFTGYAFNMNEGCVSWESRKQRTVALSSTEAEYMSLSEGTKEAVYLKRLLRELGTDVDCVKLSNDNSGAQKLAMNPIYHARTKHIDIRHHFVREAIAAGFVRLQHLATEKMPADILTKALTKSKHENCDRLLGLSKKAELATTLSSRGSVE